MDPVGGLFGLLHSIFAWFSGLLPGGFGLLLIPLGILGLIALLGAARR